MISRSALQRTILSVAVLMLAVIFFYVGKGHTVFVDNYTVTVDGQELKAIESVSVSVDGHENEEMGKAERVQFSVAGPNHRVTVEVLSGGDSGKKVEKRFSVPLSWDAVVLSVPAIVADRPTQSFTLKYTPPPREEAPVEKTVQQDDSDVILLPGTTAPAAPKP